MKKAIYTLVLACMIPLLCACSDTDYTAYLSDVRSDLFCAETEDFSVTVSCISREYPYASDGIPSEKTSYLEIVLTGGSGNEYEVYVLDDVVWGGDMSFRNVSGDYYYSRGVSVFPKGSISLRVIKNGDDVSEITATSVKNGNTLSVESALSAAVEAERDTFENLTANGVFYGEIYVRLLRRDKNYYYVGIVDTNGTTVSLLLDSETGDLLARRVS